MIVLERFGSRYRPQNALLSAFTDDAKRLAPWLQYESTLDGIAQCLESRKTKPANTAKLGEVLLNQYDGYSLLPKASNNVQALAAGRAFTVTTGHQLCVMGGPAYFVYKILSTIKLADMMQQKHPEETIVPVFWMASEDHDKDEIAHCSIRGKQYVWDTAQSGAVGQFQTDGLQEFLDTIWPEFEKSGAGVHIKELFSRAYSASTLAEATRDWVNAWFGQYGLVIVDGNAPELKQLFKHVMLDEALDQTAFRCVSSTNAALAQAGFSTQVNPREINLFYLRPGIRVRIERKEETWQTSDGQYRWTKQAISDEINEFPERFSPNVLLRPLYQELLLPNLAYVGGPGEIAYWLQLKSTFEAFNVSFPALVLRDSALVVSLAMQRKLAKLSLTVDDLVEDREVLQKRLIAFDDDALQQEAGELEALYAAIADKLAAVDNSLRAAAGSEAKKALDGIHHLKTKLKKSLKAKEEVKLNQLQTLLEEAFPGDEPQDRSSNFFFLTAGYESAATQQLLDRFNPLKNQLTLLMPE